MPKWLLDTQNWKKKCVPLYRIVKSVLGQLKNRVDPASWTVDAKVLQSEE